MRVYFEHEKYGHRALAMEAVPAPGDQVAIAMPGEPTRIYRVVVRRWEIRTNDDDSVTVATLRIADA